jgi:hypothetical protein
MESFGKRYYHYLQPHLIGKTRKQLPIQELLNGIPPLRGKLLNNRVYVTGSNEFGQIQDIKDDKTYWEWGQADNENVERWVASPFVHISNDLKVSLLIECGQSQRRFRRRMHTGDYYRFAAEVEPVREVILNQEVIQCWIPVQQVSSLAEPPAEAQTDEAATIP